MVFLEKLVITICYVACIVVTVSSMIFCTSASGINIAYSVVMGVAPLSIWYVTIYAHIRLSKGI